MGVCVCMCLCYTEEIMTVEGGHRGDVRKAERGRILLSAAKIRALFTGGNGLCHRHAATVQFELMTGGFLGHFYFPNLEKSCGKKFLPQKQIILSNRPLRWRNQCCVVLPETSKISLTFWKTPKVHKKTLILLKWLQLFIFDFQNILKDIKHLQFLLLSEQNSPFKIKYINLNKIVNFNDRTFVLLVLYWSVLGFLWDVLNFVNEHQD